MRICVPIEQNNGLNSVPFGHFGSAPYFAIYNTDNESLKVINNGDLHHSHGMCYPLKAIGGEKVDAVLVSGIGAGALFKLNELGIKVYKVEGESSLSRNIELLNNGDLAEFTSDLSCGHHHGCGG